MTATFFDGHGVYGPVAVGTRAERARARRAAANLTARSGGDVDDLRLLLSALGLWPSSDPHEVTTRQ